MSSSIFNDFLLVFTLGLSALFIWLVLYISGYWDINEDKNTNSSKTVPCVAKEVCKDPYQNCVKRVKKSNPHTDTIIIGFKGSGKVRFFVKPISEPKTDINEMCEKISKELPETIETDWWQ